MTAPTGEEAGGAASMAEVLRKRAPVLERLADGPRDQRTLRDELGVSRSTVYKALSDLEEAELVVDRGDRYALTTFGRMAWRRHDAYIAQLRRQARARELLAAVPDDCRFPLSVFEHGRIELAGRHAPERPLERMERLSGNADRIRVASPAGMPRYLETIHDRVEAGSQTASLVVERAAIRRLEADYGRFETASESDGLEVLAVDSNLPFAVVLFDESSLGLFAYDDGGLVGASYTDDETALRWGRQQFERFRERAEPI